MPKSLRCKIKKLCYNGALTERERDRILKALDQENVIQQMRDATEEERKSVKDYTANMCTTQDRLCDSCEHSRDGNINDTETCHECMWDSKYEPKRW